MEYAPAINKITVIIQLIKPNQSNQIATMFSMAINIKHIEGSALLSPVIPLLFLFLINTTFDMIRAIIRKKNIIFQTNYYSPFHFLYLLC